MTPSERSSAEKRDQPQDEAIESESKLIFCMDNLDPRDQDKDTDANFECPVCLSFLVPTSEEKGGLTECQECENGFHHDCVSHQKTCPVCRELNSKKKPLFKRKLSKLYKEKLENLSFRCPNFEKCGKSLNMI